MDKAGASALSQAVRPWAQDTPRCGCWPPGTRQWRAIQQEPGRWRGARARAEEGLGADEASLTHELKHQVQVPVILRPDHIQEPNDVWMVPKLLGESQQLCFGAEGPAPSFWGATPGEGAGAWATHLEQRDFPERSLERGRNTRVCQASRALSLLPHTHRLWGNFSAQAGGGGRGGSPGPALPSPLATDYLGIGLVLEGIEDFLDGHDLASPPVHRLPHDPIGLGRSE